MYGGIVWFGFDWLLASGAAQFVKLGEKLWSILAIQFVAISELTLAIYP